MATQPVIPTTLDAIVLLGWMPEDEAVKVLTKECVMDAPLSGTDARGLWARYRSAVENLPDREALAPTRIPITDFHDLEEIKKFRAKFRGAANILDVVQINPMELVVHQLTIVTERSGQYAQKLDSRQKWMRNAILCNGSAPDLRFRTGPNAVDVEIPHMEYMFTCDPATRQLNFPQLARHVNVTAFDNRMVLTAGYHRSYARIASMAPDAKDRSIVVPLTTDGDFLVSPASPNQGVRDMLKGRRPPLFADFFDERFVMRVKLRKKRFELQIRATIVPIDI